VVEANPKILLDAAAAKAASPAVEFGISALDGPNVLARLCRQFHYEMQTPIPALQSRRLQNSSQTLSHLPLEKAGIGLQAR
jgi:hypothetical protein